MLNLMRKQSLCKWLKSAEALLIVLVLETLNLVLEPMTGEFDNNFKFKKMFDEVSRH